MIQEAQGSKQVLLVAIGARRDGGFEVLDWQASPGDSTWAYEGLLDRLYSRGLEAVEPEVVSALKARGHRLFQYLRLPYLVYRAHRYLAGRM